MELQFLKFIFFFSLLSLPASLWAEEGHDHANEKKDAQNHAEDKDDHDHEGEKHDEETKDDHAHDDHKKESHGKGEKDEHGHAHGHEESSPKFGPGKAILAVRDEGAQFQLSEESTKFLGLQFQAPKIQTWGKGKEALSALSIPVSALVFFQAEKGVYVRSGGWIELIHIKILKKADGLAFIQARELNEKSEIAVKGTAFLRAAHLEASGQGGEGHAH